jgi:UDP-glucose 4-epimerase
MRILVTGGAGYIGSHAVDSLQTAGHQVVVLDDFSTGHESLLPKAVKVFRGQTQNTKLVHEILKNQNIEAIIHFAAFTNVAESISEPLKYYHNNFTGTVNLLNAIKGTNVKHFVFSSTAAVYKDPGFELVNESSMTDPVSAYGRSKLMSEKVISDSAKSLGLKYVVLRYFNVAGASLDNSRGQFGTQSLSLIKRAAMAASEKIEGIQVFGKDYPTKDGTGVRDFIHVQDLADVHAMAVNYLENGGESELFNCGYGHGYSVFEVIDAMKSVSGSDF